MNFRYIIQWVIFVPFHLKIWHTYSFVGEIFAIIRSLNSFHFLSFRWSLHLEVSIIAMGPIIARWTQTQFSHVFESSERRLQQQNQCPVNAIYVHIENGRLINVNYIYDQYARFIAHTTLYSLLQRIATHMIHLIHLLDSHLNPFRARVRATLLHPNRMLWTMYTQDTQKTMLFFQRTSYVG